MVENTAFPTPREHWWLFPIPIGDSRCRQKMRTIGSVSTMSSCRMRPTSQSAAILRQRPPSCAVSWNGLPWRPGTLFRATDDLPRRGRQTRGLAPTPAAATAVVCFVDDRRTVSLRTCLQWYFRFGTGHWTIKTGNIYIPSVMSPYLQRQEHLFSWACLFISVSLHAFCRITVVFECVLLQFACYYILIRFSIRWMILRTDTPS